MCIWPPEGTRGLGLRILQGADRDSDPGLEFTAEVFQGFTSRVLDLSTWALRAALIGLGDISTVHREDGTI